MSQTDEVLKFLQQGNSLTPLEALNRGYGMRLGARIYELRQQGIEVHAELVKVGEARVARYSLR